MAEMRRALVATAAGLALQPAMADCVTDAAKYHFVDDSILRAILWNESGMKPAAVNRNKNGTVDVGIAQINGVHFGALREQGVDPALLTNACVGTYVAAWHLKKQTTQFGNTWQAVGAYHSMTPHFNQSYANRVHATLVGWKLVPPGPPPFTAVPRLAAKVAENSPPARCGSARRTFQLNAGQRADLVRPRNDKTPGQQLGARPCCCTGVVCS